ncbi:uncharacterized protein LOC143335005 [Chaetodon auriga]|uniref:uncharacterized protein LOC143335005 n=1 Tax=Chaetodon auriga TaxID=39042 RepID=UPI004032E437
MSKVQTLRAFVEQRLTAAAEEIMELFERTIAEYEEELCRQRKLLDAVFKPEVRLHRADVQQLLVSQEEDPPEQQDCLDSLDQEEPPELPHIKEEQEELRTNQEADISKFTLSVPVKSEEEVDEEKPQSSQLHQRPTEQMKTGSDGEDCGGPGPDRNLNPDHLQAATHDTTSDSSEPETDDSCDWEPPSGLKPLQNNEESGSDVECNRGKTSFSSCATSLGSKKHLQKHSGIQTGVKPFSCSVCGKGYYHKSSLKAHMRLHLEGKSFSCPVCKKAFQSRRDVVRHMRIHTGEKPFGCSVCGVRFTHSSNLTSHLRVHSGEKPFKCSVCEANFSLRGNLHKHMRTHTGETPFSCPVCGKRCAHNSNLTSHLRVHSGEKPFTCSVCEANFSCRSNLSKHMRIHTGEKRSVQFVV